MTVWVKPWNQNILVIVGMPNFVVNWWVSKQTILIQNVKEIRKDKNEIILLKYLIIVTAVCKKGMWNTTNKF